MNQKYLEAVVEHSGSEFSEVKDVISRFDTLTLTNTDLIDRSKAVLERNENQRTVFVATTEEMNNNILNYTNALAQLQTRLEEKQLQTQKWQEEWDRIVSTASQKSLMLGQIKMYVSIITWTTYMNEYRTTNNLFNLVRSHMENRVVATNDALIQLERIERFVLDLSEVTDLLQKQKEREKPESAPASAAEAPAPAKGSAWT